MRPVDQRPRGFDRDRLALELGRARRPALAVLALIALAVAAATIILRNNGARLPWQHAYTTRVAIDDVSGLVPRAAEVRLKGVPVGRVTGIGLVKRQAVVTIEMDRNRGPLYRDARLRLRPKTPLNDQYLDIENRGTPAAGQLGEHDILQAQRTRRFVDIGRVLDVFNADTRTRVEQAIDGLGHGLRDHGQDLRATLVALAPFLRQARRLSREFAARQEQTRRLVHNFRLMTEELGRRDGDVRLLVAGGAKSLSRVGSVDDQLERVIAQLPPTMRQLDESFGSLRAAADQLDPAFDALQPTARAMPAGLGALRSFSRAAMPAFAELRRPLPALTALVRALRPAAGDLATGFERLAPVPAHLDRITSRVKPCDKALSKFFQNTISLTKFYDQRAVILRGQTVLAGGGTPQPSQIAAKSCAPGGPGR